MQNGIIRKTAYGLTLIVAGLVSAPYVVVGSGMIDRVSQLATVAAFVALVAAVLFEGRFRRPTSAHLVIIVFFLWQVLTVLWSRFPGVTVYRGLANVEFLIDIWLFWELASTFGVRGIAQAYILGTCVGALSTIKNYLAGQTMLESNMERYVSFGHDPNEEGIRLIIAVLMVLVITRNMDRKWLKTANYAAAALCCFAVFLTGSRTAFVALAVPAVMLLISTSGYKRAAIVAVIAIAIICTPYVMPSESLDRMVSVGRNIEVGEFSEREYVWQAVPTLCSMSPVLGLGANTFPQELCQIQGFEKVAHNVYISVLVELGVVGLLLLCSIIFLLMKSCFRLEKYERRLWLAMLAVWGIGSLTMSLDFELITWVLFGILLAATHRIAPVRVMYRPQTDGPAVCGRT